MAYDALKPADDQFISAGPGDIRANQEALRTGQLVDALKVKGYSPGNASDNIPISNGTVNTNLNADTLDGNHASAFATAGHTHTAATTSSNGFMSSTDKSKLDGIAAGADVNQNAFSNVVVGATTIQADAETDTLTFTAGANITLTPGATNDTITIAVSGTVPTAASAGTCTGNAATATTASACSGNAATATKLATARTINGVSFDGSANITVADSTKAPTSHASTATTYGVSTASNYGHAKATSAAPLVAGTAAVGTDNGLFARGDHVHPAQTSVSGNAGTATKLATARTISLTGDVSGSASFDGATNVSIAATIVGGAGALGIADYVNTGLKFGTPSGLSLPVTAGTANIGGSNVSFSGGSLTLTARKAAMPYLTSAGALGKVESAYPTAYIDNNTVGFWIFNQPAGSVVPNSAVGISSIAVANNLTPTGTTTRVDGRCDYALKSDGATTTYLRSANSTNFPTGAAERELMLLVSVSSDDITGSRSLMGNGTAAGNGFQIELISGSIVVTDNATGWDSSYPVVAGGLYIIDVRYDGSVITINVDGIDVYLSVVGALSSVASVYSFFNTFNGSLPSTSTIHFAELRSKCRTPQQIAEIAAKLLLPVCWDSTELIEPTGTAQGTLTAGGGLSAVFSGSTSKTYSLSAQAPSTGGTGNIGMTWSSAKKINSVTIYGTSDYGFDSTKSASTITLTLQGSNDGGTNWSTLDSTSVADASGLAVALSNKTGLAYSQVRVAILSSAPTTAICVARMIFNTDTTRKSLKSLLPANTISLGYSCTGSSDITDANDADWAYGRREGAVNGNRVVTQDYKTVVTGNPAAMQWLPPFGIGAKYRIDWRSAENANGLNEFPASQMWSDGTYRGVLTTVYKNGKIGACVGTGSAYVTNAWRTGGYLRPIFTLLEDDAV